MALELVLGTAIQELLKVIERERDENFRFQSILTDLKSTLDSAFPKIGHICEQRKSDGLQNDQLQRLLDQMNNARDTIDDFSKVACWNYFKKRKYIRQIRRLDASIRNFFSIELQIEQYENTTRIQAQLKELIQRVDRIFTKKRDRVVVRPSRYKVSVAAVKLKKFVQFLPGWVLFYLRLLAIIPRWRWGYQRITNKDENLREKKK